MDERVRTGNKKNGLRKGQRMFRYVALVWNVSSEQQSRTAESLDERLRARRWTQPFASARTAGSLRGRRRHASVAAARERRWRDSRGALRAQHRDIDDDSPRATRSSQRAPLRGDPRKPGPWLIENCWGNYVTLLHDAAAGIVRV